MKEKLLLGIGALLTLLLLVGCTPYQDDSFVITLTDRTSNSASMESQSTSPEEGSQDQSGESKEGEPLDTSSESSGLDNTPLYNRNATDYIWNSETDRHTDEYPINLDAVYILLKANDIDIPKSELNNHEFNSFISYDIADNLNDTLPDNFMAVPVIDASIHDIPAPSLIFLKDIRDSDSEISVNNPVYPVVFLEENGDTCKVVNPDGGISEYGTGELFRQYDNAGRQCVCIGPSGPQAES